MSTKSQEVLATEEKIKEEKKIAQENARREQARSIIEASEYIRDFRVINQESEIVLKCILDSLTDLSQYEVTISKTNFKRNISDSLLLICEELLQYGKILSYKQYGNYVIIALSESGKKYFNEKVEAELKMNDSKTDNRDIVFISHRTDDAQIADMIKDFLVNCGLSNEKVFCSSLPGNDVNEKISPEVKGKLKRSLINILILSNSYYESAYCLNEAGVAWYLDETIAIPIGLPEINHNNMVGFLDDDYKLRRLDVDTDISYLVDVVHEKFDIKSVKHTVVTQETLKLKERYIKYLDQRNKNKSIDTDDSKTTIQGEECLLLAYAAGSDGTIIVSGSVTRHGPSVESNGFDFAEDDTPQECARWKAAVDKLEECGLIENPKCDGKVYKVTMKGFEVLKKIKGQMEIDISKNPKEYLENSKNQV